MTYKFDELPIEVSNLINGYFNISAGDKNFACPYYINPQKRLAHPTLTGKGTPKQIEDLLNSLSHSFNFNLDKESTDSIRKFMITNDIGVDCSGFVSRILDQLLMQKIGKSIVDCFIRPSGAYRKLVFKMRPWSNMSANSLTNDENAFKVDFNDALPGDLIRSKGSIKGDHILFITKVTRKAKLVESIEYVHSISRYGAQNGVRLGIINIANQNEPLQNQEWIDNDIDASNPTLDGFKRRIEDNGIRRYKALK